MMGRKPCSEEGCDWWAVLGEGGKKEHDKKLRGCWSRNEIMGERKRTHRLLQLATHTKEGNRQA